MKPRLMFGLAVGTTALMVVLTLAAFLMGIWTYDARWNLTGVVLLFASFGAAMFIPAVLIGSGR